MPCPSTRYSGGREARHRWRNYIQAVDITVDTYWEPASLGELVYIVQQAEAARKHVHAVGAGYSFEDIAATPDWIVDLRRLDRILTGLVHGATLSPAIAPRWRDRHTRGTDKLVHVEAGVRLFDLNQRLTAQHLALPTMGGAQGQRLAGAFSTSTHGSDHALPPLCDFVQAVHLVTAGGRELWIESASDPVTSDDAALRTAIGACADLRIIRDDELLNAVRVGFGRFGVIYSVVYQVQPAFRLAEFAQQLPWRDVSAALARGVGRPPGENAFAAVHALLHAPPAALHIDGPVTGYRYFDLVFNPRKPSTCWVRRRWTTSDSTDLNVAQSSNPLCCPGVGSALLLAVAAGLHGYAGAVAGIPIYGLFKMAEINGRATELEIKAADPHLTGGEALAYALNAIWASQIAQELGGLVDEATQMAISGQLGASETAGRRGANWVISAGSEDPARLGDCYRGNSIEIIFGLRTRAYLDFIDAVLAQAPHHLHAGYMSVRFSRSSHALLSMHNVDHHLACSIEITSLRGVSGNDEWMRWIERKALELGGRPHWGQQNQLDARAVTQLYGERFERWRVQLGKVVGATSTFSNNFTRERGLEPAHERHAHEAWLHGDRLKVERPEQIARTSRAASAIQLEGAAGTDNWFHLAIPTPVIVNDKRLKAGTAKLRYRTSGGAQVTAVHVYDGERKIASHDGLANHPSAWAVEQHAIPGTPDVLWGIGISIHVRFPSAGGRIEVAAAGCDFISWH